MMRVVHGSKMDEDYWDKVICSEVIVYVDFEVPNQKVALTVHPAVFEWEELQVLQPVGTVWEALNG